jgi:hypothetical protein
VSVVADRWIQRTTIGPAGLLALIADTVSYQHTQHARGGEWAARLGGRADPLSVDGMIAASTTLLADSRPGRNTSVDVAGRGQCREPCCQCSGG